MKTMTQKRIDAQNILASNKSDDLKLFEIFQIYKDDLRKDFNELYYALLGWKDSHLKELSKDIHNTINPLSNVSDENNTDFIPMNIISLMNDLFGNNT